MAAEVTTVAPLRVGGLTPLTSIDFPGRLAAVVYAQGCPWRCGYCHNPGLLDATTPAALDWSQVLAFLTSAGACWTAWFFLAASRRCKPPCRLPCERCAAWAFKPPCIPAVCTPNA